jgi:alkaline phosphatase
VARAPRSGKAKNIIFLVSDGMSQGTLTIADQFIQMRDSRKSHWLQMYLDHPVKRGMMDMTSASALVTDSAAASSSWGCGHRVPNGRINTSGDGTPHEPIMQIARRNGLRTGVVTTATVTHATPAGFIANSPGRQDEALIAKQYLERDVDVMLGGGMKFFSSSGRRDDADLVGEFVKKGYKAVHNRDALLALPDGAHQLIGLYADDHISYEIDRLNSEELSTSVPSLAEMSIAALKALSAADEGFILQIEAARVDHAAHANDISGLIYDQLAFDDAVQVALQFQERHPDTLVIVTTDHGNANPGLNFGGGMAERDLGRLRDFKGSCRQIINMLGRSSRQNVDRVRETIEAVSGIGISQEHAQLFVDFRAGEWQAAFSKMNGGGGVLGQILANYTNIGWVGNGHTSDYTELAALGPGSELVQPFLKNTDVFGVMCKALDLKV